MNNRFEQLSRDFAAMLAAAEAGSAATKRDEQAPERSKSPLLMHAIKDAYAAPAPDDRVEKKFVLSPAGTQVPIEVRYKRHRHTIHRSDRESDRDVSPSNVHALPRDHGYRHVQGQASAGFVDDVFGTVGSPSTIDQVGMEKSGQPEQAGTGRTFIVKELDLGDRAATSSNGEASDHGLHSDEQHLAGAKNESDGQFSSDLATPRGLKRVLREVRAPSAATVIVSAEASASAVAEKADATSGLATVDKSPDASQWRQQGLLPEPVTISERGTDSRSGQRVASTSTVLASITSTAELALAAILSGVVDAEEEIDLAQSQELVIHCAALGDQVLLEMRSLAYWQQLAERMERGESKGRWSRTNSKRVLSHVHDIADRLGIEKISAVGMAIISNNLMVLYALPWSRMAKGFAQVATCARKPSLSALDLSLSEGCNRFLRCLRARHSAKVPNYAVGPDVMRAWVSSWRRDQESGSLNHGQRIQRLRCASELVRMGSSMDEQTLLDLAMMARELPQENRFVNSAHAWATIMSVTCCAETSKDSFPGPVYLGLSTIEMLKQGLSQGYDIRLSQGSMNVLTPYVRANHHQAVETLLRLGFDATALDERGMTPRDHGIEAGSDEAVAAIDLWVLQQRVQRLRQSAQKIKELAGFV